MNSSVNPTANAVTHRSGKVLLFVTDTDRGLPANFMLVATKAPHRVAIRLTGGCKNMGPEDKRDMLTVFAEAFEGYRGVIASGATRQADANGEIDPMVTDIPGVVAATNPECIALGTAPRTDTLTLQGESRLVLDGYGTGPNPALEAMLLVQYGPDQKLDWNGDLPQYLKIMESWKDFASFSYLGVIAWNGGDVTRQEILESAKRGWLTILMEGSGRATDDLVSLIHSGGDRCPPALMGEHVVIVPYNDSTRLRTVLIERGFIVLNG